jgi:hypothetical protein
MPVLATKHTPDGAVAFAKFFSDTIDWGYATSSPAYMNHYFDAATCQECRNLRTVLTSADKHQAYYRGSRTTTLSAEPGALGGPNGADSSAVLRIDVTAWDVVDAKGQSLGSGPPSHNSRVEIWVKWRGATWHVVDMKTTNK